MSWEQRGHIQELAKSGRVYIHGVDLAGCPVVVREDERSTVTYAIRRNGTGRPPVEPVLELEDLDEDIAEVDREFIDRYCKEW